MTINEQLDPTGPCQVRLVTFTATAVSSKVLSPLRFTLRLWIVFKVAIRHFFNIARDTNAETLQKLVQCRSPIDTLPNSVA